MKHARLRSAMVVLTMLLVGAASIFAGTTGKIAGKVIDKETGFPLPSATVILVGTTLGAATDLNGEYFILNIPPGSYDLRVSIIGYTAVIEKGVQVSADLTTQRDFSLSSEALQLGDVVEVIAERPLIQKDVTASSKVSSSDQIQSMPVTTVNDAVALNAGAQGSGNNLHIRGGRAGEVAYIVDGLSVEDPQARTIGLNVGRSALSELQIISGGFNAEYGNAQSGIILLNTQEAKRELSGHVFVQTDHFGDTGLGESGTNFNWYEASLGGPEPITTHVLPALGLKIPGYMTLYAQGETRLSDRANFHNDAIADINAKSAIQESPFMNTSPSLRNETIFDRLFGIGGRRENVQQGWETKLLWQMAPNKKLTFGYRGNHDDTHGWAFATGRNVQELVATAQRLGISDLIDQDNDGRRDEEVFDELDNDGDGRIDEDTMLDQNFYLGDFAWGLDNDGDSRIDEEALNGIDDDGDGLIDEDLQGYNWNGYDQLGRTEFRANQLNLNWTHTLNANTFYEVKIGRFHTFTGGLPKIGKDGRSRSSFEELDAWLKEYDAAIARGIPVEQLPFVLEPYRGFGTPAELFTDLDGDRNFDVGEPFQDYNGNGLYDYNNDPRATRNQNATWQLQGPTHPFRGQWINGVHRTAGRASFFKRASTTYSLKFDLTSQVTHNHQVKGGFEANYFELRSSNRDLLAPYDGRGLFGNDYSVFPNWQAGYIQDKMEFSTAIVNLGLRVERFDAGQQVENPDTSVGVARYTIPGAKFSALPRIGFSFPVTDRDMFYFSYGHFSQRPQLTNVYNQVNQAYGSSNSIVGNPDLDPEKTIQYEFGIRHQFGLSTLFSVTGFFKDIDNLVQIRQNFDEAGNAFFTYFNDTYGTVKGLELQLTQRAGRFFSGDATYTFQVAKATHSDPRDTYDTLDIIDGVEFPADWDQRHRIVINLDYHYGKGEGPRIGNFHLLENFNINVLGQFGSGLPYTPNTLTNSPLVPLTNTVRYPWTQDIDLRARRYFTLTKGARAGLVFEVQNLLNRRNAIGPDDGGIVDAYRNLIGYTNGGTSRSRNYGGYSNAVPSPFAWANGRIIRLGFTTEF